jgi:hypothetical protein
LQHRVTVRAGEARQRLGSTPPGPRSLVDRQSVPAGDSRASRSIRRPIGQGLHVPHRLAEKPNVRFFLVGSGAHATSAERARPRWESLPTARSEDPWVSFQYSRALISLQSALQ